MNGFLLAGGIVIGLLFCLLMVFKILPALDHNVKKNHGPFEACIFTRCCPLLIGLPFYFFTIWMTIVIVFREDKGISVIHEVCDDDYDCTNVFAWGRAQFDLDACTSPDCGDENLQARSGQKPLHFPRLGLGQELNPETATIDFTCTELKNGTCIAVESSDESCECTGEVTLNSVPLDCASTDCFDDIADNDRSAPECLNEECTSWKVSTDSEKQFSFWECECKNDDCSEFSCETFVMQYFYPNVFYAACATVLFVLPLMIGVYSIAKTQLRKIIKCGPAEVYVYSQEAGLQSEFNADNLATGGFNEEQKEKSKYRTLGWKDIIALIIGPIIIGFFTWQIILVSGRVGLSFVCVAAVLILLVEIFKLVKHCNKLKSDLADRKARNNPDPFRAEF